MELSGTPKTYEGIWNLFIREHFIEACHKNLQTFLRERKITAVNEVAEIADNYVEAHGGGLGSTSLITKSELFSICVPQIPLAHSLEPCGTLQNTLWNTPEMLGMCQ